MLDQEVEGLLLVGRTHNVGWSHVIIVLDHVDVEVVLVGFLKQPLHFMQIIICDGLTEINGEIIHLLTLTLGQLALLTKRRHHTLHRVIYMDTILM